MTLNSDLISTALASEPGPSRLVIGFSGGLDSTVLLHLAQQWQREHPAVPVIALHVNHRLQSLADKWQFHCELLCQHWQIPFVCEVVQIDQTQASLEQAARDARYGAFRRQMQAGDVLLLAHHRDDQVETLLQRLMRGSGPLGLGGMGRTSVNAGVQILRPLLEQDRTALEQYGKQHQLDWIDDPSNQDNTFERNFLRNDVLPLLRSRWPQLNQTVARSARLSRDAAEMLDELADIDGAGHCKPGQPLPVGILRTLRPSRALNLLRVWLRRQGATPPSEAQLQRVLAEMLPAPEDGQPELLWGNHQLRRFQQALHYVPRLPAPELNSIPFNLDLPWFPLPVGAIQQYAGQGVAFSRQALAQGIPSIRVRTGGERLKPLGRPTKTLKQWLQAFHVPPWWRDHWPILYCGDAIAGLPGLCVCEGFAPRNEQDSIWLEWLTPIKASEAR